MAEAAPQRGLACQVVVVVLAGAQVGAGCRWGLLEPQGAVSSAPLRGLAGPGRREFGRAARRLSLTGAFGTAVPMGVRDWSQICVPVRPPRVAAEEGRYPVRLAGGDRDWCWGPLWGLPRAHPLRWRQTFLDHASFWSET